MHKLILILCPFILFGCIWDVRESRNCDDDGSHFTWTHPDDDWEPADDDDDITDDPDDDAPDDGSTPDAGPEPSDPTCDSDDACEADAYCDLEASVCMPASACEDESDCEPGFNCDDASALCLPADSERCSELDNEADCAARSDCETTYAGVDCSCGPDCTCMGGEPGCVCDRFEFFFCADAEQ